MGDCALPVLQVAKAWSSSPQWDGPCSPLYLKCGASAATANPAANAAAAHVTNIFFMVASPLRSGRDFAAGTGAAQWPLGAAASPAFGQNDRVVTRRKPAEEVVFKPVDNARLAALCGPLDANLRQIETALDVSISRRGERFAVSGPREKAAQAAQALRRFYDQAGRDLTVEDIQLGPGRDRPPAPRARRGNAGAHDPAPAELTARTPRQAQYLSQMRKFDITFCVGPAGTGKTFLAVAAAVDALERDAVKRIVLTRPAVEAGEKLGFLPGDLAQKVDPYLRPSTTRSTTSWATTR